MQSTAQLSQQALTVCLLPPSDAAITCVEMMVPSEKESRDKKKSRTTKAAAHSRALLGEKQRYSMKLN
jgi:hypothetical protein